MSGFDAFKNFGAKVSRRALTAHKPLVRLARRGARDREHRELQQDAVETERQIAALASGGRPIIAGPWLAEVGYEVLYWIPFLRWFCDAHRVPKDRLVVLSRGGMETAYRTLAGRYVDMFDLLTPEEIAVRGQERRDQHEGGGQKQSALSTLDEQLLSAAGRRACFDADPAVLHPSLMFRLYRNAWHGTLPMDVFWRHARYQRMTLAAESVAGPSLPESYVAVKLYTGHSLAPSDENRQFLRAMVGQVARHTPVVTLETPFGLDEHRDIDLTDVPNVISMASHMTPRNNLAVQLGVVSGASRFIGACGGLAWLAPFLGVPTVGVFDNDHLLAPHLLVARQAGKQTKAAEFSTLDLRAVGHVGLRSTSSFPS